jgi:hypothetical protein
VRVLVSAGAVLLLGLVLGGCGPALVIGGAAAAALVLGDDGGGSRGGVSTSPAPSPSPGQVAVPPVTTASPQTGTFSSQIQVALIVSPIGASTYYTLDGTTPTQSSTLYSGPLTISATTTLRFFSVDGSGPAETPSSEVYTIVSGQGGQVGGSSPVAGVSVDRTSGKLGYLFTFDASSSTDAQDSSAALEVRWDWEDDGTWDTAFSTTQSATHKFTREGTQAVRAEVRDTSGLTSQVTRRVCIGRRLNDVNGDGIADFVVGASDFEGTGPGKVYVFFGKATLLAVDLNVGSADLEFTGEAAGDEFGFQTACADLNADGISDVCVGARSTDFGGASTGRAYVFFGGAGLKSKNLSAGDTADATLTGKQANDEFGYRLAVGDLNGDKKDDLVVGAPHESGAGSTTGFAHVYLGKAGFASVDLSAGGAADFVITGAALQDTLGLGMDVGDVTGDGQEDLVVASPHNDAGAFDGGRVYVFQGGAGFASVDLSAGGTASVTFTGAAALDELGFRGVAVADVNGDGIGDVNLGSYLNDTGGNNSGRIHVFFGGAGLVSVDLSAGGNSNVTYVGKANSGLGNHLGAADLNGDGVSDLIAGTPGSDAAGADAGEVYVFFGGAGIAGRDLSAGQKADLTFVGQAAGDRFGYSAGYDASGDGRQDLVVGALWEDTGGAQAGRVYVFLGGALADKDLSAGDTADVMLTGKNGITRFGVSVVGP